MVGPSETTASPTIRRVQVRGKTVVIIDATTGTDTTHNDNHFDPQLDKLREIKNKLRAIMAQEFKPLPRRHIPWSAPQSWSQKLTHPDFPYCRGKLAADARTLSWMVKSNPARAEPELPSALRGTSDTINQRKQA